MINIYFNDVGKEYQLTIASKVKGPEHVSYDL